MRDLNDLNDLNLFHAQREVQTRKGKAFSESEKMLIGILVRLDRIEAFLRKYEDSFNAGGEPAINGQKEVSRYE